MRYIARMIEHDAALLAAQLRRDFPAAKEEMWGNRASPPPIQVVDCVLSLRRPYEKVVLPRVRAFATRRPEIATCLDLRDLIGSYPGPAEFLAAELDTRHARRAATLVGVVDYVLDVQARFDGGTEAERLLAWARWARPGDYLAVGVPGFGLAGFQYLRLLFGAETSKPDVHIIRYVSEAVGRTVTDIQALYALERASELVGVSVRALDSEIWKRRAGG
jgi:hypothetical protein